VTVPLRDELLLGPEDSPGKKSRDTGHIVLGRKVDSSASAIKKEKAKTHVLGGEKQVTLDVGLKIEKHILPSTVEPCAMCL